jgi:hypothetical protein
LLQQVEADGQQVAPGEANNLVHLAAVSATTVV